MLTLTAFPEKNSRMLFDNPIRCHLQKNLLLMYFCRKGGGGGVQQKWVGRGKSMLSAQLFQRNVHSQCVLSTTVPVNYCYRTTETWELSSLRQLVYHAHGHCGSGILTGPCRGWPVSAPCCLGLTHGQDLSRCCRPELLHRDRL